MLSNPIRYIANLFTNMIAKASVTKSHISHYRVSNSAMQRQKAVSAYITRKQILPSE